MTTEPGSSIFLSMQSAPTVPAFTSLTMTFEMNGKGYRTDEETLDMLRSIVPSAKSTGDSSAVMFAMDLGLAGGRIVEITT